MRIVAASGLGGAADKRYLFGRMKRIAAALAVAVVTFFLADSLRALGQSALAAEVIRGLESGSSQFLFTPRSSIYLTVGIFAVTYLVAGAAIGWMLRARLESTAAALAVGFASPLSTLPFGPPMPFTWSTHSPAWLELVFWANWYVPPMSALAGALLVRALARRSRCTHAAND